MRRFNNFRRHWALTSIAVFSLSIAMALGVAALSASNTMLILPPAAPEADRLATIYGRSSGNSVEQISYPDYAFYRSANHVFLDIAAAPDSIGLLFDQNFEGRAVRALTRPVSANYFAVLGIRPFLGHFFEASDEKSSPNLAVMTYSFWDRVGRDAKVVGRKFGQYTIIGVAPREFTGSLFGLDGDLLTPLAPSFEAGWMRQRQARRLFLVARMKTGISRPQAQAEMTLLSRQLASAYPKEDRGRSAVVARATLLPPDLLSDAELASATLLGLTLLVLVIACANVGNLLVAMTVGRRHEAAVKLALGAPRTRLVREFLREGLAVSAASALLGWLIAQAVIMRFSQVSLDFPMWGTFSFGLNLHLDLTVAAFTIGLTLLAALATGVPPALQASSAGIAQILGGEIVVGGTHRNARRNALAVAQIATSTLVLIGLGLCLRNLYNLRHTDLGFNARNLVSIEIYPQSEGYDETRGRELYRAVREKVSALPGVKSVSLAQELPLMGGPAMPVSIPGESKNLPIQRSVVDENYFRLFGIPLVSGRAFNPGDRSGAPDVIVVNRKMADYLWPGQRALGESVMIGNPAIQATVVGVVANSKYENIDEAPRPFFYYALSQHYPDALNVVARTAGDPRNWLRPLAQAIRESGFKAPIRPATFESWMNLNLLSQRIMTWIVGVLSALGLVLAGIGLAGAICSSVVERRKELGIRIALGAGSGQLQWMILREISRVAGLGISIGIALGICATAILRSQFYQIQTFEWVVVVPVSVGMLLASLVVAWLAGYPWLEIDPMEAVRHV